MATSASPLPFADLEGIERDASTDLYAAAPETVRRALGLQCRHIDGGALLMCRAIDDFQFNRLAALGLHEPARADSVERALSEFAQAGLTSWVVQVPDRALGLAEVCARLNLQPHPLSWVKFHRSAAPIEAPTRLTVRPAEPGEARAFGAIAAAAFDMPGVVAEWLSQVVGRPRWHCFLAFDGTQPVATGAAFIDGGRAWLGMAGTLASHRRMGAQSALLAARIRKAAELGCTLLTTETDHPRAGAPAASYRNIQRAGFEIAYVRPNLTRAG